MLRWINKNKGISVSGPANIAATQQQPQPNMVNVPIPVHLQNLIPFFGAPQMHPSYPVYNQPPFINPAVAPAPGVGPLLPPFPHLLTPLQQHAMMQASPHPMNDPGYITQQPNPQSLQKPSVRKGSSVNSKELLSLLHTKSSPKKKEENGKPASEKVAESSNFRSRAQELLSVFPKKQQQQQQPILEQEEPILEDTEAKQKILSALHKLPPVSDSSKGVAPLLGQPEPSNEIEESIRQQKANAPRKKKMMLLKRSDKPEGKSTASEDLLSLLKPQKPEEQKQESPSNEILGLLKQPRKHSKSKPVDQSASSSSKQLLDMLHKPVTSPTVNPATELMDILKKHKSHTSDMPMSSVSPISLPEAGAELLGILNQNRSPTMLSPTLEQTLEASNRAEYANLSQQQQQQQEHQQQDQEHQFEDFEDFEQFEDAFDDFNGGILGRTNFANFDIASDEEDVDHLIDQFAPATHAQYKQQPQSSYYQQPQPVQQQPQQQPKFEPQSLDHFSPKKVFNQSQYPQYPQQQPLATQPPPPQNFGPLLYLELFANQPQQPQSGTNAQGQGLLALLNGGKPAGGASQAPSEPRKKSVGNHHAQGQGLLALLNRGKPPSPLLCFALRG
ncbi:uncharacterized protein J8A68_005499 [[Candida] subhashii]|uniref:Uncharacterized protein n=1 Tax=[Candida] subhashii TaxID=561895 RepID=A0A8J5UVG2_9ASCO|nr:uncharacterized protein J8A68_005499 [[Candida] subhashii]KAG7660979.1 hypothetical protein J8A68_005499 [[Candida] subhashii]